MISSGMKKRAGMQHHEQDIDPQQRRAKAMPRSRNTRTVICHSPSPAHSSPPAAGVFLQLGLHVEDRLAGARPAISAVDENHALEVLVIDGLLLGHAHDVPSSARGNHRPRRAFHRDLERDVNAGALGPRQDHADHERLAFSWADAPWREVTR
jgi:hypothetical protein